MSPRNPELNARLREESKERLLQAGLKLFAENGYSSTSIAQIAKEAKMAKGSVYHYFDSKESLLLSIFDMLEQMAHHFSPTDQIEIDPKEQLRNIIDDSIRTLSEQQALFRMIAQLSLQMDVIKGLEERLEKMRLEKLAVFRPVFEKLGYEDPETEVLFLGAILDGMLLGIHALTDHYPTEKLKKKLFKLYQL